MRAISGFLNCMSLVDEDLAPAQGLRKVLVFCTSVVTTDAHYKH
jgi:hypothetical protein